MNKTLASLIFGFGLTTNSYSGNIPAFPKQYELRPEQKVEMLGIQKIWPTIWIDAKTDKFNIEYTYIHGGNKTTSEMLNLGNTAEEGISIVDEQSDGIADLVFYKDLKIERKGNQWTAYFEDGNKKNCNDFGAEAQKMLRQYQNALNVKKNRPYEVPVQQ